MPKTKSKHVIRLCQFRDCGKRLEKGKRAHAHFCDDRCRKSERNAALIEKGKCRACAKKRSKRSKVYCDVHLERAKAYKRRADTKK